ncbi:M23 family metallopeptidase [Ruegeria sp.]|uniref:M23 family metallopeptidase n=1 Tax=Ruegeria sp. TaxID=1879320 RepID=UPI00230DFA5E|nr:M23 family metallopeptidase [Ruegeria sp.]MDA7965752.1 M23 family metallopeptidase [Ruegeria sp.]
MRWPSALVLTLVASPAASDFLLQHPVDCELGKTCHIQNYVDHQPAGTVQDFRCGGLSYDGHKGTDFALPNLAAMRNGVAVLAAAPGIVQGVRNGMTDQRYEPENAEQIAGRECGNGVVIAHENGWETQYCHMRRGSVRVKSGDRVEAGTVLGEIGLSGKTQFPHLHLSVRKDGQSIDPFVPNGADGCTAPEGTLWQDTPDYVPGSLISVGFSDRVPEYDHVLAGDAALSTLTAKADAIVFYGHAFGSRPGDILRLEVTGPQGTLFSQDVELDRAQAQLYRATGRRLTQAGWHVGTYQGVASLIRDGETISQKITTIPVR